MLLPPGAEPHTWEPKPSDVLHVSGADIFLYIGAGMEPWVDDILEAAGNDYLLVVEASPGLKLISADGQRSCHGGGHIHEHTGRFDPHVWLDFGNDLKIVDKIVEAFSAQDPAGRDVYRDNAREYRLRLRQLDRSYRESLRTCERREIVFGGHGAFAYLAGRYGLRQVSLYGLSPDSEPTPKQLARVVELARERGVKAVYYELFVSDKLARVMAREVGAEVLILNPAANLTREQRRDGVSFISIMRANLESLRQGLGCE
jgi:zinc transport system substrate-binding protein